MKIIKTVTELLWGHKEIPKLYAIKDEEGKLICCSIYTDRDYTINAMSKTWWDEHPGAKVVKLKLVVVE